LAAISQTAIRIAYGQAYIEGAAPFALLTATAILPAYLSINTSTLQAIAETKVLAKIGAASAIIDIALVTILVLPLGANGAALARTAMFLTVFLLTQKTLASKAQIKINLTHFAKTAALAAVVALPLAAIDYAVAYQYPINPIIRLILEGIFFLVYTISLRLFTIVERKEEDYNWNYIKKNYPRVKLIREDIAHYDELKKASKGVDAIVHAANLYAQEYAHAYGLRTGIFRMSCINGERQFGVEDQGWVAWFTIATVTGKPITIYGDGKQVRDVLYVSDLVGAFDAFLERSKTLTGEVFNIGGGPKNTLSLIELIGLLEKLTGKRSKIRYSDWRPSDQKVYISDISKAGEKLGWSPKVAPKDGVKKLVSWVLENAQLFK